MKHWRDELCRRRRRLLDRVGLDREWFRVLSRYYRGLTRQEFWIRYTIGRMEAARLWEKKPRRSEADYRAFYAETDYFVLRRTRLAPPRIAEAAAAQSACRRCHDRTIRIKTRDRSAQLPESNPRSYRDNVRG